MRRPAHLGPGPSVAWRQLLLQYVVHALLRQRAQRSSLVRQLCRLEPRVARLLAQQCLLVLRLHTPQQSYILNIRHSSWAFISETSPGLKPVPGCPRVQAQGPNRCSAAGRLQAAGKSYVDKGYKRYQRQPN